MQDPISYTNPCKRFAGKRFLLHSWDEIHRKYMEQTQFHKHGAVSKMTLRTYKPKYVLLAGKTPLNQCLCDYCENCDLLLRVLSGLGVSVPANKYAAVNYSLCSVHEGHFGTSYKFTPHKCIMRNCDDCGRNKLKEYLEGNNEDLQLSKRVQWHQWKVIEGKSAPQKCEMKGTLKHAVNDLLDTVEDISLHLFRANWHRHIFDYIKGHLEEGYLLQVMDFAMNFNNWYQDEVQSAYWTGTQTTIHATMNFFKCTRPNCQENVTLAIVHLTDDMKHDSFLSRAAQQMTFRYLAKQHIPLDLIIQFCDNCAAQYKSRRPFVEMAKSPLDIIRVYFGEKHGKSHADGLFGRLKSWMSYQIKSRRFVVKDGHDFYNYCKQYYETPRLDNCCQHYRVEFEFIHPSDIRCHHDADLDHAVPHTQELYSVRNTPEPLKLKVRSVPCLCKACIDDSGAECLNSAYTDPWRLVTLVSEKGANKRKYQKIKHPCADIPRLENTSEQQNAHLPEEEAKMLVEIFKKMFLLKKTQMKTKAMVKYQKLL